MAHVHRPPCDAEALNESEAHIMRQFQLYHIRANEMLCFTSGLIRSHPALFRSAIGSLVERGFVTVEDRRDAYTLTSRGYRVLRLM